ncbi:MAG: tetratricopeptide repeat protein, partial [Acidobacteriia bacterium]|nr:tetratricopeptide repeat protein [Terriglobia bacterium]
MSKKNGSEAPGLRAGKVVSPALAKSVALHLEGKRKEALRELNTAIENGEETAEVFAAKGHVQFELEQYDDAIKTYEKLLSLAPRHPTANFNLGICYEKLGRWQEATDAFQKSLEIDPQREEAQLGLGICLLHQEKPEPAIGYFDKVLQRQPAHETALFGKAVSQQLLWKFDEATALYLKILEKNPQSEECLVNLITIGMARKDNPAIQQYSERLLTMRPHSQAALEGLATCAFHSNDFEAAATYCGKL